MVWCAVKLPGLLAHTQLSSKETQVLATKLNDFIKYGRMPATAHRPASIRLTDRLIPCTDCLRVVLCAVQISDEEAELVFRHCIRRTGSVIPQQKRGRTGSVSRCSGPISECRRRRWCIECSSSSSSSRQIIISAVVVSSQFNLSKLCLSRSSRCLCVLLSSLDDCFVDDICS